MKTFQSLGLLCLLFAPLSAFGEKLPQGAALFPAVPESFTALVPEGAESSAQIVAAAGPGFDKAWRVTTGKNVVNIGDVELATLSAIPVEEGGAGLLHLWMRTVSTADETGKGRVYALVRKNGVDFNSSLIATLDAGKDWQEYTLPFTFIGSYPAQGAYLHLDFGYPGQVVEVGAAEILYYGKALKAKDLPRTRFSYAGREADAPWRKAALERIEAIRKSPLSVRVTDALGKPVPGAKVSIRQTRSAFEFGTCIKLVDVTGDTPDAAMYREKILELFNAGSPENDFKWQVWLGEWEGNYDRGKAIEGLRWMKEHHLAARGHVLVWPGWKNLPKYIRTLHEKGMDDHIMPDIAAHIADMAAVTKGLLEEWDVLNEPYTNHDLMDFLGDSVMPEWFKEARAAMPGVRLAFNDFANQDESTDPAHCAHFEKTIRYLLENGAPVDVIGLQAHISGQPNAPEKILKTLDRYDRASGNLPVRFTEFDVRTDDEALQADYTRDFLIMAYSHPTVIGVQFWGFWEKFHWIPQGAMLRADWSEKPAAKEYRELVLKKWRTNASLSTDAEGSAAIRAFQGEYAITVTANGVTKTVTASLPAGGAGASLDLSL
jgi:GH35 family endo-1,4-beta-xylanase